jgi:K+-transporting ATPase ATPase B chain
MLRPDIQWSNPVMFVVEIGAVLTLLFVIQAAIGHSISQVPITYFIALDAWLFLTVLFANFATALAEARGKAQAESPVATQRLAVCAVMVPPRRCPQRNWCRVTVS